jgi:hypothetical protein
MDGWMDSWMDVLIDPSKYFLSDPFSFDALSGSIGEP